MLQPWEDCTRKDSRWIKLFTLVRAETLSPKSSLLTWKPVSAERRMEGGPLGLNPHHRVFRFTSVEETITFLPMYFILTPEANI